MRTEIFIVTLPSITEVLDEISSVFDNVFEPKRKKCRDIEFDEDYDEPCDFTPKKYKVKDEFGRTPKGAWGVCGEPADENLRFGYQGPCVDEPRCEDYNCRWEFEDDHEAYDRYIDASEDCIARGLEKKSDAPIHKCNAIRKPIGCPPPMKDEVPTELIGESHWWNEDIDWDF